MEEKNLLPAGAFTSSESLWAGEELLQVLSSHYPLSKEMRLRDSAGMCVCVCLEMSNGRTYTLPLLALLLLPTTVIKLQCPIKSNCISTRCKGHSCPAYNWRDCGARATIFRPRYRLFCIMRRKQEENILLRNLATWRLCVFDVGWWSGVVVQQ